MESIFKLAIDIGNNLNLKDENRLNSEVEEKLIEKCRAAEVSVINCTPSAATSSSDSLIQRVNAANISDADFLISISHNACNGRGSSEIYTKKGGKGEKVANSITSEMLKFGFKNCSVRDGSGIFIIDRTIIPAILIKNFFCDTLNDVRNYDTGKMAEAIFTGVCKTFKVETINWDLRDEYHIVARGETLWGIARNYGISVKDILVLNGVKIASLIPIEAGDRIRVK